MIHGWSALGGLTMARWEDELERWLMPFLDRLGHKTRQRMCPLYVAGLIGPGDRKSVQPMAERLATGNYNELHHFIADGVWDATPLETELLNQADRLVGGKDAVLVIDDTSLSKKGTLGWCCGSIRVGSRQNGKLPNAGVFDACAWRSASDGRVAPLSARQLDKQHVSSKARSRASRTPNPTVQAGNCVGRN
jgi:hypothetical protein